MQMGPTDLKRSSVNNAKIHPRSYKASRYEPSRTWAKGRKRLEKTNTVRVKYGQMCRELVKVNFKVNHINKVNFLLTTSVPKER